MKRKEPTLVELKAKAEIARKVYEEAQKKIEESTKAGNAIRTKS